MWSVCRQAAAMDQPLRHHARLLFTVLFISQVCGTPIFWSQPDCYQNQFSDVQYDSYENYQGPSYQETLQAMVEETLRAISEIIQVTARVTKQSLSSIFQNPPSADCNNSGGAGVAPEEFQFASPQQPVSFPGDSMGSFLPYPIEPWNETPVIAELPLLPTVDDRNSSSPSQPSTGLDNKIDNTDNNSTERAPSQAANATRGNNLAVQNNTTGNNTTTLSQSPVNSSIGNNVDEFKTSTISSDGEVPLDASPLYSADDMDALVFSTEQPNTEDGVWAPTETGALTAVSETTTGGIPTVNNRKPKL